ncbi:type IV pilus biogenesis/stability protein PilW [Marinobacterium arenosum]|uniref:type IV pilus biogenesis/stability protein PilW n=1 Tax=Marinobacterium arenosum TaxID=2862496 RepID=UPI0028F3FF81|nr:type IV pilus biogenesis/stability protein PilW [Marinobacterium arenosum]
MKGIRVGLAVCALLLAGCAGQGAPVAGGSANPHSAKASYTQLGLQYLQERDGQNAKEAFLRALEIDSNYAEAFNGLALTFQLEGDQALAEQYFDKAVAAAPDSAMVHNNYGAFLFRQQRYQDACRILARATEDPFYSQRAQAFENLGRCYRQIGRDDVAEHAFRRALRISTFRPLAMVELSDLLLEQQRTAEAKEWFERFSALVEAKRVDHYAKSLWLGIRLARAGGDASKAATYALILKNLFPQSPEFHQYKESSR